jgi:hypothetical protein
MRRIIPSAAVGAAVAAAVAAVGGALWHVIAVTQITVARFAYPIELEGLEGLVLYQASRLLHHQPLYHAPGQGFIPQTHPPFHAIVLAAAGWVFGLDYSTGRAVSIAFFTVACASTFHVVARQFRERLWGIVFAVVAVGWAASSSMPAAMRYDLVHDDSLALGLTLLAGAIATSESLTWRRVVCIGLVLTAMGFTRVTTVFPIAWIVATVLWRSRRHGIALAAGIAVASALAILGLQWTSDGWFWTYTVGLHAHHDVIYDRLARGVSAVIDFAPYLAIVPLLVGWLVYKRQLRRPTAIWVGLLVTAVPSALLPYMKIGGAPGDLAPLVFLAGPVTLLLASDIVHALANKPTGAAAVRATVLALAAVCLITTRFEVALYVPPEQAFAKATALVDTVAALDGDVICPSDPFLPIAAGHATDQISLMSYIDLSWAGFADVEGLARDDIARIAARWAIVDMENMGGSEMFPALFHRYEWVRPLERVHMGATKKGYASFELFRVR